MFCCQEIICSVIFNLALILRSCSRSLDEVSLQYMNSFLYFLVSLYRLLVGPVIGNHRKSVFQGAIVARQYTTGVKLEKIVWQRDISVAVVVTTISEWCGQLLVSRRNLDCT